jgi:hypothetical protein
VPEKASEQPDEPVWSAALRLARSAQRCGARTRRGSVCQCPAVSERKRCRLHGGLSPGAPPGVRNGNWKHGHFSQESEAHRRRLRKLIKDMRRLTRSPQ